MKNLLVWISITAFCLGTYFFIVGKDKKDNYHYSEYSYKSNHNAYVGGDAYNYIINGNYFTGFMVLGSSCYIFGILCVIGQIIVSNFSDLKDSLESANVGIINEIRQEQAKLPSLKTLSASYSYRSKTQNGISASQTSVQNPGNYYQNNQNQNSYR